MDKKVLQEIHNNETLYQDINMLDGMLNEIIVCLEGRELADTLERIRRKAKALRDNHSQENYCVLKNEIDALDDITRKKVIRAFTVFLYLFNIAEQNFRVRIRRRYQLDEWDTQPFSIEDTVKSLKDRQVDEAIVSKVLNTVSLELITTAHPTESTKRTILDIQRRIVGVLRKLEQRLLTNRERITLKETLFNDIAILWQTDELRRHKPTVYDEVEAGLYYFDQTLFEVLPEIHRELEMNLSEQYPEKKWRVPNFLSFGTWIGGDRDGNQFVTHDVTWKTMLKQRELVIKKYIAVLQDLTHRYTHTTSRMTVDENFAIRLNEMEEKYLTPKTKWSKKGEVYRRYFAVIIERVSQVGKSEIGYKTAEELLEDLFFVQKSLRKHHPAKHELKTIQKIIRQVQLFGFHLATLDIRNHSGEHESAITEILQKVGLAENYSKMIELEKVKLLTSVLQDPRRVLLSIIEDYTPETQEMIRVFQTIKRIHDEFGTRAIEVYLISMFKSPSDLLEVLLLAKEANLYRLHANGKVESYLNIAPLFETIDDLTAAPCIMEKVFNMPLYRQHLQTLGNRQEIMFGYSDSSKDGGTLTASWKLFKAQIEIHKMALHYGVDLKFFHGRGGSLGRGGGTLNRSLTSQPAETIDVGLKITEQGEVLSFRYLIEDIAYRSLEQAVAALLQIAVKVHTNTGIEAFRKKKWEDAFEKIAAISHKKYRSLVFDEPEFINYFYEATPLIEIGGLNIGSRPIARKNLRGFEYLRAIPWVFSWAQCRQMLPAWFAAGTGLTAFANEKPENLALMQEMYAEWPFFRNTIDNLQLALLKADMPAASEYVTLVKNQEMANRIFDTIKEEYAKTEKIALQISGDKELYAEDENLRQSTLERNPYIEVLNFLQVDLINKLRSSTEPDAELMEQVLLTINGISVGIRSTG